MSRSMQSVRDMKERKEWEEGGRWTRAQRSSSGVKQKVAGCSTCAGWYTYAHPHGGEEHNFDTANYLFWAPKSPNIFPLCWDHCSHNNKIRTCCLDNGDNSRRRLRVRRHGHVRDLRIAEFEHRQISSERRTMVAEMVPTKKFTFSSRGEKNAFLFHHY